MKGGDTVDRAILERMHEAIEKTKQDLTELIIIATMGQIIILVLLLISFK